MLIGVMGANSRKVQQGEPETDIMLTYIDISLESTVELRSLKCRSSAYGEPWREEARHDDDDVDWQEWLILKIVFKQKLDLLFYLTMIKVIGFGICLKFFFGGFFIYNMWCTATFVHIYVHIYADFSDYFCRPKFVIQDSSLPFRWWPSENWCET